MVYGSPCIAEYDNVCLSRGKHPAADGDYYSISFDESRSACNGTLCSEAQHAAASTGWREKFPIRRHFRRRDDTAYEPIVALLPSLPTGSLGDNMAHVLYDSLALEAKVWLNSNSTIDVVLGSSYAERPHDPVHELRRRLFARSRFEPLAPGQRRCFRKLWSYSWSCDRSLRTYGSAAFNETLLLLRSLARHTEAPTPTVIFYARSDTTRRRIHNASAHFAALREMYGDRFAPIYWDEVWGRDGTSRRRPSVDEQIHMIRNAARIITPHGAFPSVWGLFMRPDAVVYELTAACIVYTWLPAKLLRQPPLSISHTYLSWRLSDEARAHGWNQSLELVHPSNDGRSVTWSSPWCCCRSRGEMSVEHGGDFDLRVPTEQMVHALQHFEERHGQKPGRGQRFYMGSEY